MRLSLAILATMVSAVCHSTAWTPPPFSSVRCVRRFEAGQVRLVQRIDSHLEVPSSVPNLGVKKMWHADGLRCGNESSCW